MTGDKLKPDTRGLLIEDENEVRTPLSKWIKETKKSYQVTRKDILFIYRNVIFGKTVKQLEDLIDDDKKRRNLPVIVAAIITSVLGDIRRGYIVNITHMLKFVFPNVGYDDYLPDVPKESTGYNQILELEEKLRKLEGDDAIMIVDKLLIQEAEVVEVESGNIESDS